MHPKVCCCKKIYSYQIHGMWPSLQLTFSSRSTGLASQRSSSTRCRFGFWFWFCNIFCNKRNLWQKWVLLQQKKIQPSGIYFVAAVERVWVGGIPAGDQKDCTWNYMRKNMKIKLEIESEKWKNVRRIPAGDQEDCTWSSPQ